MKKTKKDYLDDLPEQPKVIQLCEFCDSEATEIFTDFLGNKFFLCKKCYDKKIKEHEEEKKMMRESSETNIEKRLINIEKRLKECELNFQKLMKAHGKRI